MKTKMIQLMARYQTGSISGTYFRRVKVLILKSNARISSAKASRENGSLFLSEFNIGNKMATMHKFDSSVEAYDSVQCDEAISTGDLIWIPNEGIVAVAYTWPFAITKNRGSLHHVGNNKDGQEIIREFNSSVTQACKFAEEQGYELNDIHTRGGL